jgi:hypothetical protein
MSNMVEKIRINASEHSLVSLAGSHFVVDVVHLKVIGRLYEGTLEAADNLGEAFVHVERLITDDVRTAVIEKMVARAVTQTVQND